MTFLPIVVRATHRGDHRIHLVFNDGVQSTVDCADRLTGVVFEPLTDVACFKRFFIEGGTIA